MKKIKSIVILAMLFIMIRCATTSLSAIRNQDFPDIKLHKIMIVAPFTDIGMRQDTEGSFIASLETFTEKLKIYHRIRGDQFIDVNFLRSIEIIPPFKEYSTAEIKEKLHEKEIDGILVVALEDYWTSHIYIPKSTVTTGEAKTYGSSLYYSSYTQESGGYYISKPRVKFEIRLYDVTSGEVIWMATPVTSGNAFARYGTLVKSLSRSIIEDLYNENIFKRKEK